VRTSVLIALVLAGVLALPAAASACSLNAASPAERVARVDAAVYGRVIAREHLGRTPTGWGERYRYTLEVKRVFKGRLGRVIAVEGTSNDAMCGVGVLRVGAHVGLLLRGRGEPWPVGLFSRISRAELERAVAARRKPRPSRRRG
jgi:hypothetical protein